MNQKNVLSDFMEGFVHEKRSVGYKFQKGADTLKRFNILITQKGLLERKLPKELVMISIEKTPNETKSKRCNSISIARGFAEYVVNTGRKVCVFPVAAVTIGRYS